MHYRLWDYYPMLAEGKILPEMKPVIAMTDKRKSELTKMLTEHKQIEAALLELLKASKAENHPEATLFAEQLLEHAKMEEVVSYPTAILIGEYLKLKL